MKKCPLLLLLLVTAPLPAAEPVVSLDFGGARLTAELALDQASRERGLMYRAHLAKDHGMLFRYERAQMSCMWMKNTSIALTVAFLDQQGRVINLRDLVPQSREPRCSSAPASYAVEARQGWFAAQGVRVGDQVEGLEALP